MHRAGRGALRGGEERAHGVGAVGERGLSIERTGRHTLEAESEREALVARLDERSQRRSLFSGS